jgi:hypothetical protein
MKNFQPGSWVLLAGSLLALISCANQRITLVHPQSGATVECTGSGSGLGAAWVQGYIEDCTRRNEDKGYVPLEKLTPEQRDDLQRRGLLPRT